jgi:flavin reductase (DIM6/NTAB) family NADH-FMN oxidoreductase RutF
MVVQEWKCSKCGKSVLGTFPPEKCPECGAERDAFLSKFDFSPEKTEGIIKACFKISYGLYVVSSFDGDRINGQICNTLFQITSEPPRMAIGINHGNLTHEYIEKSGVFAASILGKDDQRLVRRFGYRSGREFDKFKGVPVIKSENGCPVLKESIGYLECRVLPELTLDAGTHSIFVGDISGGSVFKDEEPMTYALYQATKNG